MTTPTVVCVLRGGKEYTRFHVIALYDAVKQWWPSPKRVRFVALTDTPIDCLGIEERPLRKNWPGWWAKMEMFSAEQDDLGDILYFDLDTMIVGPLDSFLKPTATPTLLEDFYRPEKVQTGLMYLPLGSRPDVYAGWMDAGAEAIKRLPGDGDYLDMLWRKTVRRWQGALPGQVLSYKVHIRQRKGQTIPDNARVICFHGRPRPWDTALWLRA